MSNAVLTHVSSITSPNPSHGLMSVPIILRAQVGRESRPDHGYAGRAPSSKPGRRLFPTAGSRMPENTGAEGERPGGDYSRQKEGSLPIVGEGSRKGWGQVAGTLGASLPRGHELGRVAG